MLTATPRRVAETTNGARSASRIRSATSTVAQAAGVFQDHDREFVAAQALGSTDNGSSRHAIHEKMQVSGFRPSGNDEIA
jgi:hypothetical protein